MEKKEKIKSSWKGILLILFIILIVYFLIIWIGGAYGVIEEYKECVDYCVLENQDCVYSINPVECSYWLEDCVNACES